jgi:hypothetical protein
MPDFRYLLELAVGGAAGPAVFNTAIPTGNVEV